MDNKEEIITNIEESTKLLDDQKKESATEVNINAAAALQKSRQPNSGTEQRQAVNLQ